MGRPLGAENKGKRLRAAFGRLYDAHPDKLDELARVAHELATGETMDGDVGALSFIRDTMDGKPAQAIVGGSDEEGGPLRFEEVRRVIVDPKEDDFA